MINTARIPGTIEKKLIPNSALAINPMGNVSPRYQFIDTNKAISQIEAMGYQLHSATEARVTKQEKRGYQKHLLRFRLPQEESNQELFKRNGEFPEIVVVNSHDGASAMRIMAGFFRLACANGLISGSITDEIRLRHVIKHGVDPAKELEDALRIVAGKAQALTVVADTWKRIQLSDRDKSFLVSAAIEARSIGTKYQGERLKVDSTLLLKPKRQEDKGTDLWSVFNVIQEKIIKAPLEVLTEDGEKYTLRTPKALDRVVAINKALWQSAESVAA